MSYNSICQLSKKSYAPGEKVKKASVPLPKKLDSPSERVKKSSGDFDDIKNMLVTTIETVDKEGTTRTVDQKGKQNPMCWRKPSLLLFKQERKIDTVNKT